MKFLTMDFSTNYCGPYWSDGIFQSSVVGKKKPVNQLDQACYEHDAAYATASNIYDYNRADRQFLDRARKSGYYRGFVYGPVVYYGNKTARWISGQPTGEEAPHDSYRDNKTFVPPIATIPDTGGARSGDNDEKKPAETSVSGKPTSDILGIFDDVRPAGTNGVVPIWNDRDSGFGSPWGSTWWRVRFR